MIDGTTHVIRRFDVTRDGVDALAELLVDAVDDGAAVSFMQPLSKDRAADWWRTWLPELPIRSAVLVACTADGRIDGVVALAAAWAPNQPHRGDVMKLLVHRRARRSGLGVRLMQAVETEATTLGLSLLTLDARAGGGAEALYRRLGWIVVGYIPAFALDPDGKTHHDDVLFYKNLSAVA